MSAKSRPPAPLVPFRAYQKKALWNNSGLNCLLWSRQVGKSTTLAAKAAKKNMATPGSLVTYASASLAIGGEVLVRMADLFNTACAKFKAQAEAAGLRFDTSADGLGPADFLEVFEKSKFEFRVWHTNTVVSRTKVVAPSVATFRGWSGDVYCDEIGFIKDFADLWEAAAPIVSSNADFRVVLATTLPKDDSHFVYSMFMPPEGWKWPGAEATGHFYRSRMGVPVHYLTIHDAYAAGVTLYDMETRKPVTAEEHRAADLNREAWDRNYALSFIEGGSAALPLTWLHRAAQTGRDGCMAAEDDFPPGWQYLIGSGAVSIGLDPATTDGEHSNPTGLVVLEEVGRVMMARLVLRFKTADPAVTREKVRRAIRDVHDLGGRRVRKLSILATGERFFAVDLKAELAGECPVQLVIESERIVWHGQAMSKAEFLSAQLVTAFEDGAVGIPESKFVNDDLRLVKRNRGQFVKDTGKDGSHADCFDAMKAALHGLTGAAGGPAEAAGCGSGQLILPDWGRGADGDGFSDGRPVSRRFC